MWTIARVNRYSISRSEIKCVADGRTQASLRALSGTNVFINYCTDLFAEGIFFQMFKLV
jgi:hypothetical protein